MSRSTYIYLVLGKGKEPIAAFTVKHELRNWLNKTTYDLSMLNGWRMYDGLRRSSLPFVPLDLVAIRDGVA